MIHSVNALTGSRVMGRDGEVGTLQDFYFDDERWAIRYLIVRTGSWFTGREVLVSPVFGREVGSSGGALHVDLTRAQIESAPDIDTAKPVSRQMEATYGAYYGYPPYWTYGYAAPLWGWGPLPTSSIGPQVREDIIARELQERENRQNEDHHLRSAKEVVGYGVEARDGAIGRIEDFLFDGESWAIRSAVMDTRNWWPSKHVVIPPERFESVSWQERRVKVSLTRDEIRSSPEFGAEAQPETTREAGPSVR
jgi:hypothetical protein